MLQVMQPEFVTGTYCFMVASKGVDTRRAPVEWDKWKVKGLVTKYYNQDMHSAAFAIPVRTCFTGTEVLALLVQKYSLAGTRVQILTPEELL